MGQTSSKEDPGLYEKLLGELIKCPITRQLFLPLHVLEEEITAKTIRVNGHVSNPARAEQIAREARKVFAILLLIGRQDAIGRLHSDGLTDEYLPLERGKGDTECVLKSCQNQTKLFKEFRSWDSPAINYFLEKQWQVQAPVFDAAGGNFKLSAECALPLVSEHDPVEQIGHTECSTVYRCILHSSHYQGRSEVSVVAA